MKQPISYTEFHRRLEAASASVWGSKVLLNERTKQPTEREFAKERKVLEAHGISDFELEWDMGTRSFRLRPQPLSMKQWALEALGNPVGQARLFGYALYNVLAPLHGEGEVWHWSMPVGAP